MLKNQYGRIYGVGEGVVLLLVGSVMIFMIEKREEVISWLIHPSGKELAHDIFSYYSYYHRMFHSETFWMSVVATVVLISILLLVGKQKSRKLTV